MIEINKGAELYDRHKRKSFVLDADLLVKDVQKHEGHCRFWVNDQALALTYVDNKGKYKFFVDKVKSERMRAMRAKQLEAAA
jgi:hypothetical protein